MKDGDVLWFKYVRRADIPRYLEAGWIVCQLGGRAHHDEYAVIMEYDLPGEPPDMEAGGHGSDLARPGPDRPSAD